MAANLGLLAPASAQTVNSIVFLSTTPSITNDIPFITNSRTVFQNEATARSLDFVDGTGALSGSGTLPVDANTKVLVLVSVHDPISPSSLAQLASLMANNPALEVLAFIDGCPSCGSGSLTGTGSLNITHFVQIIQAIAPASWPSITMGALSALSSTVMPLNTLSSYATSSSLAALPQIVGNGYLPMQNVLTDYALYVDLSVGATTTPTTNNVYGLFIPQAISNSGVGACVFAVADASMFLNGPQPAQSNAIAQAFTSAAFDANGACGLPPTVSITKTADVTTALVAGDVVHYTVTVTNTSTSLPSIDVLVSDPIPTGIDPASVSWTCSGTACPNPNGPGALNETIASLPADAQVVYTITATAGAAVPATVTNAASVSGPDLVCADGETQPCTAKVSNPFAQADMQGSGTTVAATVGTPVSVDMVCTNAGPNPAVNATCTVTGAPAGATTTCTPASPVASLAVNGTITCTTTFTPRTRAQITLVVTAGSDTPDPNRANDTARVAIVPVATLIAPTAAAIPTLSEIALLLLAAALGVTAVAVHRRGR